MRVCGSSDIMAPLFSYIGSDTITRSLHAKPHFIFITVTWTRPSLHIAIWARPSVYNGSVIYMQNLTYGITVTWTRPSIHIAMWARPSVYNGTNHDYIQINHSEQIPFTLFSANDRASTILSCHWLSAMLDCKLYWILQKYLRVAIYDIWTHNPTIWVFPLDHTGQILNGN